jgi:membrane-bound serine protease (ClpP class)
MRSRIWLAVTLLVGCILTVLPSAGKAQEGTPLVLVLTADGPLTPAMHEYLKRGLRIAEREGAEVLILQLDTPGGSIDLMNSMVQDMLASSTPIVVYVAPSGAIAGSAGTVITLAGHAAAMAPGTAIGAASPVGPEGQDLGETMEAKEKNILMATVRSLAEKRSERAVEIAQRTIGEAHAVSASEAHEAGLVDFIAENVTDLVKQLDGYEVTTTTGQYNLETTNAVLETVQPSFIEQLLATLTNPNIVFLLLTIGVQAILIEISSPGGWVAGFIGISCLALAAYGIGVLPVNWFGFVFLALAFVLFILDIKAPTHGALTAAGVASLIIGGLVLFNSPSVPSFQRVSVPLIVGSSITTGVIFFTIMLFAIRAQKAPHRMGMESMTGRVGTARSTLSPGGVIQLGGEQWTAELASGEGPITAGEKVQVVGVQGVRLLVRKVSEQGS